MAIRNGMRMLALACTLACAPALAEVQGQATLGNLRFTLFDLDPNDAVTPSLEWILPGSGWGWSNGYLAVQYEASGSAWNWGEYYNRYVYTDPREPGEIAYTPGAHVALSAAYAHPDPLGQMLSLAVRNAPRVEGYSSAQADVHAENLAFRLSPNTRVSLSVDMSASSSVEAKGTHAEYLELLLGLRVADYLNYYNDADAIQLRREVGTATGLAPEFDEAGTLTVDFSNPYGFAREASLELSLGAQAWASPISAVPEPSSQAMLLAGAVLFGWRRLRCSGAR